MVRRAAGPAGAQRGIVQARFAHAIAVGWRGIEVADAQRDGEFQQRLRLGFRRHRPGNVAPGLADADQSQAELNRGWSHRYMIIGCSTRQQAWDILCEFTKSEGLRKHALAVEACVLAYARKLGEDEGKWSVAALLHDFDWEIHPSLPDHPTKGEPILAERGVPRRSGARILLARQFHRRAAGFAA